MGRPKLEPRVCVCGYTTSRKDHMDKHSSICKEKNKANDAKDELIASLKQQLADQNKQMTDQLAAKDKQIEQLIKRPRVQNNKFHIINNNLNCFGRESLDHITADKYIEFIRDPETSVAKVVAALHSVPENDNVAIPNIREKRWLVMDDDDGEKRWKSRDKTQVLEQLWERNALLLECEVDEETKSGERWNRWVNSVRASQGANSKLYREQLDLVENSILDQRDRPDVKAE